MDTSNGTILPNEVASELIKILVNDEKASLLLKGFILGREIKGNITIIGAFKILHEDVSESPDEELLDKNV